MTSVGAGAQAVASVAEPPEWEGPGPGDHAWREAALTRREERVAARETALAVRTEEIRRILAAADDRDAVSDARDATADLRDDKLDLAEMLDVEHSYGDRWPERRTAALDRWHAKDDRAASRADRRALARGLVEQDPSSSTAGPGGARDRSGGV